MADPHALTGLIAKRAEIAGQIEHTQDQLRPKAELFLSVPPFKRPLSLDVDAH